MAKRTKKLTKFIETLEDLRACTIALNWVEKCKSMKEVMACKSPTWALWLVVLLAGTEMAAPILRKAVVVYLKMLIPPTYLSAAEYKELTLAELIDHRSVRGHYDVSPLWHAREYLWSMRRGDKRECATAAHFTIENLLSDLKDMGYAKKASAVSTMILKEAKVALKEHL